MQEEFSPQPSLEKQRNLMYLLYGLFGLGMIFGGLPTLIGVILAYIRRDELLHTYYHDHINYLIRTFWGVVIGMLIGGLLTFIFIGVLIIWAAGIWYIFRVVYGFIKLMDNQSVTPTGWLK